MQLTVPQQTDADQGSFPTKPESVALWLKGLRPLESDADARKVYRGLKHSNRLHNDVGQRRAVLSCFAPVLGELQAHLADMSLAQPLPLSKEFARNARLADALYREEAFAFKILLSDSQTPLAEDASRAMQALAKQAEAVVHAYRPIPDSLLQEAHQLYAMAEEHNLLPNNRGTEVLSIQDYYRFILLLSIAELNQQRSRQLALLIEFLKSCVRDINIEKDRDESTLDNFDFAVCLIPGSRPEPALSLVTNDKTFVRWFSIAPVLYRIDTFYSRLRTPATSTLGVDTLERQSLARLHVALSKARQRRTARKVLFESNRVVFGHKEVCAHLLYQLEENSSYDASNWRVINSSLQGMCLQNPECRAGLVQVGELISITDPNEPLKTTKSEKSSKLDAALGVVRWVRVYSDEGIAMGVEILARSVLPVRVLRDERNPASGSSTLLTHLAEDRDPAQDIGVGENALIVACKVQNSILQTILTPSYLYQTGDVLTASQGGRSRKMRLRNCLQTNGLFSQYSLVDASTD